MKAFNEIQEMIVFSENNLISRLTRELEKPNLKDWEIKGTSMAIEECKKNIANVDEVSRIEVGSVVNTLIQKIQNAYKLHLNEYWSNFNRFMEDFVIGLDREGKPRNGIFFGQGECLELGLGLRELSCLQNQNPMDPKFGDSLRTLVNNTLGTNIPMAGVEEQALEDYNKVAFSTDEVAKAEAFVHLKEVQRDAGTLRAGGIYYPLANDINYQDAKEILNEKTL